jgi:type IV pilus assembly protein PilP
MAFSFLSLFTLGGCGDNGVQEVREWMDDTKRQTKISIPKLSEPKRFIPFTYTGKDSLDPYDPAKLAIVLAKMRDQSTSSIKPDLDRRREPLEAYPLDAIKMVGTLQKTGLNYAILQVDKAIFHVKAGNYIGQNLGMITRITDNAVELKEIVQDASGDWIERKATLELQETSK